MESLSIPFQVCSCTSLYLTDSVLLAPTSVSCLIHSPNLPTSSIYDDFFFVPRCKTINYLHWLAFSLFKFHHLFLCSSSLASHRTCTILTSWTGLVIVIIIGDESDAFLQL
ncbi:hypothetical protein OIU79_002705 [Salix purpurea]|uniref:Uncharacterized protein n=1 Tax=Salix purpurea TaxID=77065 RepID=A0A9Q0UJT5_SALPP|nr:hypothetical protein OIU79_002705 [Salix purpurea]